MQPAMSRLFPAADQEELETREAVHLRLSLVLIDVPGQLPAEGEAIAQLQEAVRRELQGLRRPGQDERPARGGAVDHTDAPGSHKVVGPSAVVWRKPPGRLNLGWRHCGPCRVFTRVPTAEALVSQAVRDAEPVAV